MAPFTLRKLPYAMRETKRLNGSWRGPTAGGCANFDSVVVQHLCQVSVTHEFDVLQPRLLGLSHAPEFL